MLWNVNAPRSAPVPLGVLDSARQSARGRTALTLYPFFFFFKIFFTSKLISLANPNTLADPVFCPHTRALTDRRLILAPSRHPFETDIYRTTSVSLFQQLQPAQKSWTRIASSGCLDTDRCAGTRASSSRIPWSVTFRVSPGSFGRAT